MELHYKNLLSPIKIGKYVIKNRMLATNALPHFINGPEIYPGPDMITYYSDLAKNGPGIVTFMSHYGTQEGRNIPVADVQRFPIYDENNPAVDNYISQITEVIRFYGALPATGYRPREIAGYDVSTGDLTWDQHPDPQYYKQITAGMLQEIIDETGKIAKRNWANGFRMTSIPMGYECSLPSRFLSSRLNTRTDEYGGSLENRARYPFALLRAIKQACPDMLVEVIFSGEMPGLTADEVIALIKMAETEGILDMVQIRAETCLNSHPTCFSSSKGEYKTIGYAARIKKSGVKLPVIPVGSFTNPDDCERFLEEGCCDMFGMGRAFICDSEFSQKIFEDRAEDIVPCIRCNKCHVNSMQGPYIIVCSVNPVIGLQPRLDHMLKHPKKLKKVAVIGGGPAGLQAAMTAAKLGHSVTLFEKSDRLGGQLFHADYVSFKWPLRDFRDYLIAQNKKLGVDIRMATDISPKALSEMGFDAVLAAVGAVPERPRISGIDKAKNPLEVFGREEELGARVVVVGCAETGLETAMHIAQTGRQVTVLSRQREIAPDCNRIHYREFIDEKLAGMKDNLKFILEAATTEIDETGVGYRDKNGAAHTVKADSVVVSGGIKANAELAMSFFGCAPEFYIIGDCKEVNNLQTAVRSGYAAASLL